MNDIIKKQLQQVKIADLSHFNKEDNTYFIPQKKTIKLSKEAIIIIFPTKLVLTASITTTNAYKIPSHFTFIGTGKKNNNITICISGKVAA